MDTTYGCVACHLAYLARKYREYGKEKSQAEFNSLARDFWECCRGKFWAVDATAQQDCEEFFLALINNLMAEFDIPERDVQPLTHMFQTVYKVRTKCQNCGIVSYSPKSIDYVLRTSPPETGSLTLHEAIERTFTEHTSDYHCIDCRHTGPAVRRTVIRDAPEILVIRVNRHRSGGGKLVNKIRYNEKFDLTGALEPYARDKDKELLKYELYSTIFHEGNDVHGGHYYAHVRTPDDRWVYVNDEDIGESSASDALGDNTEGHSASSVPYVLVYIRKPFNCPDPVSKLTTDDSLFHETLATIDESTIKHIEQTDRPSGQDVQNPASQNDNRSEVDLKASFEFPNPGEDSDIEVGNSPPIRSGMPAPVARKWEGQPAEITVKVTMGEMVLTGVLRGILKRSRRQVSSPRRGSLPPERPQGVTKRHRLSKQTTRNAQTAEDASGDTTPKATTQTSAAEAGCHQ
ncbi:hypothetical protein DIZ76_010263 [Coccidioides immitis]|nr:hypothetical protein DIZ76_010263 [Coccidioides immitis]